MDSPAEETPTLFSGNRYDNSTDFSVLTRRLGTPGRFSMGGGRPVSQLATSSKTFVGNISQRDMIKHSLAELDRATKPYTPKVTPLAESHTKLMMANTYLDETPQDGDLSMSFTCRPPELHAAYRTPTFMDLSNITRDQSFTSTPIIIMESNLLKDDGMTVQNIEFRGMQEADTISKETTTNLFKAFHHCYTSKQNNADILELIKLYELACEAQVKHLAGLNKQHSFHNENLTLIINDLALECGTWQLIGVLFTDRLTAYNDDRDGSVMMDIVTSDDETGSYLSSKEVVDKLYQKDAGIRQSQLVIDWLEKLAEPKLDTSMKITHATDSVAWESTLHDLQCAGEEERSDMVSAMDPDAPVREKKPLSDLDMATEQLLTKHLFRCIRAGKLAMAEEICCSIGQFWRAASLEGWKLFHDPNLKNEGFGGELLPLEGNISRGLWKESCWDIIREGGLDDYEKAMYAALIGDLDHMLTVCDSWHDYLWAYYKAMIETIIEQELQVTPGRGPDEVSSLLPHNKAILSPELIFQEIRACKLKSVQQGATCPYRLVQRDVILNNMQSLVNEMYMVIKHASVENHQLLRFVAHMVLFIKSLGVAISEDSKCVEILRTFVMALIRSKQGELVAAYAAALPYELQITCYSELLEEVTISKERQRYLMLADEAGLDTACITRTVVQNICSRWQQDVTQDITMVDAEITSDDIHKIKSIGWLVFDPTQRLDLLIESNTLIRAFLARGKHHAAMETFEMIPSDARESIMAQWQDQEIPHEVSNGIQEHLCISAYLDALGSFDTWFKDFHDNKPAAPRELANRSSVDELRHAEKHKVYQKEMSHWKIHLTHSTQDAVTKIKNVLLFGPDGWMVDSHPTDGGDSRTHQMKLLRQLCLPKMCFILHTVLHSAGRYRECLEIADMVASGRYKLYEVFSNSELEKLLSLIRESSIELSSNEA